MTNVTVKSGDLTKVVRVDAIVTLINSAQMWFGGVDGAIMRVAGDFYHSQARGGYLEDGQVIVAKKGNYSHAGSFDDVIFVVDDLRQPLGNLVYSALCEAKARRYQSVAFPLMRTGVMLGVVEPNFKAVAIQMKSAISKFIADDDWDLQIYIVIYNDPEAVKTLLNDGSMFNR